MPAPAKLQQEVEEFFGVYAKAFERHDAAFIAGLYAYPAHITSDVGKVTLMPLPSKVEWTRKLEDLLFGYRRIGVQTTVVLGVEVTELSALLVQAHVHWALNDADDKLLYDFDSTYTLGRFDDQLRITNLVIHNEIPSYRAETLVGGFKPRTIKI